MISEFVKDIIRYIPSKVVPAAFGILTIPLITRLLEPNDYGQYVIVMSTFSLLSIVAMDWLSASIIRFYSEYEKESKLDIFYGTVVRMTGISIMTILLFIYLTLFLLRVHFETSLFYYLNIGVGIFIFGAVYNIMLQMLIVKRKPNQYSLFTIWQQNICILIGIGLVMVYKMGADGLLWGTIIGIVIMLPLLFKLSFKNLLPSYYSKRLSFDFIRYGFPLVASNFAYWVLALSDRYIIKYFRGSHEVGLYSISYSIADRSIQVIVSLILIASAPIVIKIWDKEGVEETRAFLRDLTRYYLIIALPATVGLCLLSGTILKMLTTKSFYEGHRIIPMVATSIFLFGLQRNFQLSFLFYKKTKIIMYIMFVASFLNIVLNFLFVPKFGFIAAGYTTLASYVIFAFLIICISRKYFVWKFPFSTLVKVIISTFLMSVVISYILELEKLSLPIMLIISVIAGSLVYFTVLIIMKELDMKMFKRILSVSSWK
jgi:O-antigen/teichoic acid export membrane protein